MANKKPLASGTVVYQLKVTLQGIRPPVWRRVQLRDSSLADLHDVIQISFGWEDDHLHVCAVGGEEYGARDPMGEMEYRDERKLKLSQLVAQGIKKFSYTYDFGDNWEHAILIEKTVPAEADARYPRCIAGARAGPPEDCGGPWGYADLVEAVRNPQHEGREDLLEWLGDDFDPEACDLDAITKELQRLN